MHPAGLVETDQDLEHHACHHHTCLFHRLGQIGGETGSVCERACRLGHSRGRGCGPRTGTNNLDCRDCGSWMGGLRRRGVLARLDDRHPRMRVWISEVAHPRSVRGTVAGPALLFPPSSTSRGRHRVIACCRAGIGSGASYSRRGRRGRGSGRV